MNGCVPRLERSACGLTAPIRRSLHFGLLVVSVASATSLLPQAVASASSQTSKPMGETELESRLAREIDVFRRSRAAAHRDLSSLYSDWERRFSTQAVPALLTLARRTQTSDAVRFTATLGAVRLGGVAIEPELRLLLQDRSWMVRSAALQGTRALRTSTLARDALALIDDPALVIRAEAVSVARELRPEGYELALVRAASDPRSYRSGHPLWVPEQALLGLIEAGRVRQARQPASNRPALPQLNTEIARRMLPIARNTAHPTGLRSQALASAESWLDLTPSTRATLAERVTTIESKLASLPRASRLEQP